MRRLVPNLLHLRLESRAPSTVQKYRSGWLKWRQWAAPKTGVPIISAKPLHVALFISELTVISVSNNTGTSSIESVLYGIKWAHSLAGIVESNSEETVCSCNHLTHFAVLMDYAGSTKVIELFFPYSIILWAQLSSSILSFNFPFFDTAHRGRRNNSENYHLRGTEPFHRRNTFNINTLFLPHVSNVPE